MVALSITMAPPMCCPASASFQRAGTRQDCSSSRSIPRAVSSCWHPTSHFYENFETYRPFSAALHVGEMLDACDALRAHPASLELIVPGHDPQVMQRYPAPSPEL